MKPLIRGLAGLCLFLYWVSARALVPVPDLSQRVTDLTATLSAAQTQALENTLAAFETQKGSQIAVLIVPTTQPEDIEQFGIRVADAWKIGRKNVDDGVILIVAKNDRRMRLEVGYGLEGAIPDAIAKRIIAETITPFFMAGDFAGGIDAGVSQIMRLIEGETLPPPQTAPQGQAQRDNGAFMAVLAGGIVLGWILSAMLGRVMGGMLAGIGSGLAGALLFGLGAMALFVALMVFLTVGVRSRGYNGWSNGGYGGGFGGGGGGSWGGGGGRFGGGGASGSW